VADVPSGNAAGPSRRTQARIHITVTDPVKLVSDHSFIPGLTSSHYEYLITSMPAEQSDDWPRAEVRRRFRDVVALADLLTETQRGYFSFLDLIKGLWKVQLLDVLNLSLSKPVEVMLNGT